MEKVESEHLVHELARWGRREEWIVQSNRTGKTPRLARQREMLAAWEKSGVREIVWRGHSHRSFRKGVLSGMKSLGADDEAARYLVGHDLGVRGHYIDPRSLPLLEAVDLIPMISTQSKVHDLDEKRAAKAANKTPT